MTEPQRSPDIEIYLQSVDAASVRQWLDQRFPGGAPATWRPAGKRQVRAVLRHEDKPVPVLLIEEASPGFMSVWFDSPDTPWATDRDCAREMFSALGGIIRATAGSWHEGDDPDLWWEISAGGERELHWPG